MRLGILPRPLLPRIPLLLHMLLPLPHTIRATAAWDTTTTSTTVDTPRHPMDMLPLQHTRPRLFPLTAPLRRTPLPLPPTLRLRMVLAALTETAMPDSI